MLERLAARPVDEIVVVEGAHPLDGACAARVPCALRADWERGPGRRCAAGSPRSAPECEAAIVVLADGPDLSPAAVARVIEDWRAHGGTVVAASYDGVRGHPLLLARAAWGDVPDEGLRVREPRLVPCDDLGSPGDVDTPADLPEHLR